MIGEYLGVGFSRHSGVSVLKHVAIEIAKNAAMGIPAVRDWRARAGRTTTADQVQQIRDQFAFFSGTLGDVRGKTLAEIGPGDAIALGAMFLDAGAVHYTAYDRFSGDVFGERAAALYAALGATNPARSRVTIGGSIEEANGDPVDVIISFDVIEHLRDPHRALRNMARMLKPGGVMVHRIDYSAHDIWRRYDEGVFLTFPNWLWTAMGSNRGYPNRVRHAEMMRTIESLKLRVDERVTRRFKDGDVLLVEIACGLTLGAQFPY